MTQVDLDARIASLETRTMHQDRLIDDLNATITAQWRMIDILVRKMAYFEERMDEDPTAGSSEVPPPHY